MRRGISGSALQFFTANELLQILCRNRKLWAVRIEGCSKADESGNATDHFFLLTKR
jgi:hypothetical protein